MTRNRRNIRPTDDRLEKMTHHRIAIRNQIEKCRIITEGSKSEFWKTVQGMVKSKLLEVNAQLKLFLDMSSDKRVALLQSQSDLQYFISMVEDHSDSKKKFEKDLSDQDRKIEDYSDRLGKNRN